MAEIAPVPEWRMMAAQDEAYERRLKRVLAQFPPMSEESRRRLIQTYESIEATEANLRESA